MPTVIKNGTIVTASDTYQADILIDGEKIAVIGEGLETEGARVIDASGKYVLPGGIDVHTHLELNVGATESSDDFYTGHKAAAFGGTTTHIDFAIPEKGKSLRSGIEAWHRKAAGRAVIDYGYHANLVEVTDAIVDEIPSIVNEGVTSIKALMAYKGRLQIDDTGLFRTLQRAGENGILTMVHAENGDAIDILIKDTVARGDLTPPWHARTRPAWLETEATLRAIALAGTAHAPLYVVHMTCEGSVDQLRYGRQHGLPVMGETCTQYLFFTEDDLARPDGAKFVCSPPIRTKRDNAAIWRALQNNDLQIISTDHCPFLFDGTKPIEYEGVPYQRPGKELGRDNFTKIPNGLPGLGDRMIILWSEGVAKGQLTANRFVEITATNPAKVFGMYPRKGTIAVGSDADLLIWDPSIKQTYGVATSYQRVDYSLFEGWATTGWPIKVLRRGELIVDGDQWLGRAGSGEFVRRRPHAAVI
jgi:dihydropyrimidinase